MDAHSRTDARQRVVLITKKITIWLLEILFQDLGLSLLFILPNRYDPGDFVKDLTISALGVFMLFFSTAYLLTTVVFRAFWKNRSPWTYPAIATVLFLIHFEMFRGFERGERWYVRIIGGGIVFFTTFIGTSVLRKWAPAPEGNPGGESRAITAS